MESKHYSSSFSHIGVCVSDIEKAVEFYSKVLGWRIIMAPAIIKEDESFVGVMCKDMLGEGFGSFKLAYMLTDEKVRIEIVELGTKDTDELQAAYQRSRGFHVCIQTPDVEGLAKRIIEQGGKQQMPVKEYYPKEKPYRIVYCEDPFGNIIEIRSHSFEHLFLVDDNYIN